SALGTAAQMVDVIRAGVQSLKSRPAVAAVQEGAGEGADEAMVEEEAVTEGSLLAGGDQGIDEALGAGTSTGGGARGAPAPEEDPPRGGEGAEGLGSSDSILDQEALAGQAARGSGKGGRSGYPQYAARRDRIEQAIEKDPTLLTGP